MSEEKRICIAEVTGAHGIKGELVVRCHAENPASLERFAALTDASGAHSFRVLSVREAGKGVILRLEGVTDRNMAEAMRGLELHVARSALPEAGEGEAYHADLIGLAAVTATGRPFGRIVDIVNYGASDLLEIEPANGGSTILVPFADGFVGKIDPGAGTVMIEEVEGLLREADARSSGE